MIKTKNPEQDAYLILAIILIISAILLVIAVLTIVCLGIVRMIFTSDDLSNYCYNGLGLAAAGLLFAQMGKHYIAKARAAGSEDIKPD